MEIDIREQAEFVGQITRHQSALRAYIIALMPGMDGVSDVLQEVNVVLWEKRSTFRPGTNFRAWACAITRFEVKSHRRRMLRHDMPVLDEDLACQLADHCAADAEEVDERLRALEKCLGRLNGKERGLVEQRYFSKSTLEAFATRCERSAESLRVSLFRIRAGLKKCINGELAITRTRS
jgi:RNA polymerase sigma-70 factor, ECF subfamily